MKLEDIRQQVISELVTHCDGCAESSIAITMGVFRCFTGSESAATYRALFHETHQVSLQDFQQIIREWIGDGKIIAVESLILQIDPMCSVFVTQVNDLECLPVSNAPSTGTSSHEPDTTAVTQVDPGSDSSTLTVTAGVASATAIGVVLLLVLMVTVVSITIVKHKQNMAKYTLKHQTSRYVVLYIIIMNTRMYSH